MRGPPRGPCLGHVPQSSEAVDRFFQRLVPFRKHESHEPPSVLLFPVKGSARDDRDPLTLDEMHRAREIVVEREPSEVRYYIVRASRRADIEVDFMQSTDA